jgi:ATPase family associated with various cellular activities (AAA)
MPVVRTPKNHVSIPGETELRFQSIVRNSMDPAHIELDFSKSFIKSDVYYFFQDLMGNSAVASYVGKYPVSLFMSYCYNLRAIGKDINSSLYDRISDHDGAEEFISYIESLVASHRARFQEKRDKNQVEFEDLMYLFNPGDMVYNEFRGNIVAGKVSAVEFKHSFMTGRYALITVDIFHSLNGRVELGTTEFFIPEFGGLVNINSLSVRHLVDSEMKARLLDRGRTFVRLASGSHYQYYTGHVVQRSWYGAQTYRADGRIVVDVNTFKRIDNNAFDQIRRNSRITVGSKNEIYRGDEYDDDVTNSHTVTLSDDDLMRTWPFVYGFSFRAKQWGEFEVNGVSDIEWRDEAFNQLVLPEDQKHLVKTLVKHNGKSFSDIVEGKGGGCIFMLHGEPGQGKTLTAEAVAELLRRPLYAVSIGELGTDPDQLEGRLREILDIASVWNAVLLLDEADIFLEKRDEHDVLRNAMVGVFLRLLEYHQGVLFLTTNRVKNIDPAFYSRISVALKFDGGSLDKRKKIWTNLLAVSKVDISQDKIDSLANHEINGRQIKNIIRLSQTLALDDNRAVTYEDLNRVVEMTTAFERGMSAN